MDSKNDTKVQLQILTHTRARARACVSLASLRLLPLRLRTQQVKRLECRITLTLCETPPMHLNAAEPQATVTPQTDVFLLTRGCRRWHNSNSSSNSSGNRGPSAGDASSQAPRSSLLLGMSAEVPPDEDMFLAPAHVSRREARDHFDIAKFYGIEHRRIVTSSRFASMRR